MKKIYISFFLILSVNFTFAQLHYVWNSTSGTGDYQVAANWTPVRNSPNVLDTIDFANGGSITVTNIPTETVKALYVQNNTDVTFNAAANPVSLRLNDNLDDPNNLEMLVGKGSKLTLAGTNVLKINLSANGAATGNNHSGVYGTIELKEASHKILSSTAAANTPAPDNTNAFSLLEFYPGSMFLQNFNDVTTKGWSFFLGGGYLRTVQFDSASTFEHYGGLAPFIFTPPSSSAVFKTGSNYVYKMQLPTLPGVGDRSFAGRVYSNFIIDNPLTNAFYNFSVPLTMDSFIVKSGVFGFDASGSTTNIVNIKGNMHVYPGATMQFNASTNAATANDSIYLNGTSPQLILNEGTLNIQASPSSKTVFDVASNSKVTLLSDVVLSQPTAEFEVENNGMVTFDSLLNTETSIQGAGSFNLAAGSLIGITSVEGITSAGNNGNITTATRTYSPGANYIYSRNKSGASVTGDGLPVLISGSLEMKTGLATPSVNLTQPTSLSGSLKLTNGKLVTSSTNLLTLTNTASSDPGKTTSFINGPLSKIGNTDFIFPVGKATTLAKGGIKNYSGSTPSTTQLTVEYFNTGWPSAPVNSPLTRVSRNEYWDFSIPGGTLGANTAQVELYSSNSLASNIDDLGSLVVAHFNSSSWDNAGAASTTGTVPGAVSVLSNPVSAFSPYTFGSTNNNNPLPVVLMNFNAVRNGNVNNLSWTTSQEINSGMFIIERSVDGSVFDKIGQVTAAGNSTVIRNYKFTDANPSKGINYYRLRIVDIDNSSKYGPVRNVRNAGSADLSLYPNPVQNQLNISITSDKQNTGTIIISGMNGSTVYSKIIHIIQGVNIISADFSKMANGNYVIKLALPDDTIVQQFSK